LQDVLTRLDRAFQAFFRRVKHGEKPGYPRFKRGTRYDSFTDEQFGQAAYWSALGIPAGKYSLATIIGLPSGPQFHAHPATIERCAARGGARTRRGKKGKHGAFHG